MKEYTTTVEPLIFDLSISDSFLITDLVNCALFPSIIISNVILAAAWHLDPDCNRQHDMRLTWSLFAGFSAHFVAGRLILRLQQMIQRRLTQSLSTAFSARQFATRHMLRPAGLNYICYLRPILVRTLSPCWFYKSIFTNISFVLKVVSLPRWLFKFFKFRPQPHEGFYCIHKDKLDNRNCVADEMHCCVRWCRSWTARRTRPGGCRAVVTELPKLSASPVRACRSCKAMSGSPLLQWTSTHRSTSRASLTCTVLYSNLSVTFIAELFLLVCIKTNLFIFYLNCILQLFLCSLF